jgi:hypothetical protein
MGILSVFELRKEVVQVLASQQQQQPSSNASGVVDELRYDLILHGMVPLQCTPASACTVVPKVLPPHLSQQQQQQQPGAAASSRSASSAGAGSAAAQATAAAAGHRTPADVAAAAVAAASASPLLVVGSEAGVTLLRMVVDDAGLADQQQLEQLLTHVNQVRRDTAYSMADTST